MTVSKLLEVAWECIHFCEQALEEHLNRQSKWPRQPISGKRRAQ